MLVFILEMTLINVDSHGWYCDRVEHKLHILSII